MANDIVNSSSAVSVLSTPTANIARATSKAPPVTPTPKKEENGGRSFAEELAHSPDRGAGRDSRQAKIPRGSKDSAEKEKTLAADQPKKISQTVKNAAAATKDAIEAAPSVAFISGRLDAMDPSQIPTIVADTPFLSQAMAHEDIAQFMAQPTSILNLVRNLGLPVNLITEVQKLGIEPDQMMAPVDFLKAIGVDPQQVTAELSLLKGNVLAEGMLPYLNRAQALTAKNPKIPTESGKTADFKNPLDAMKLDSGMSQISSEWTPALLASQFGEFSKDRPKVDETNLQAAALLNAANLIAGQQVQNAQPMALVDLNQPSIDSVSTLKIEGAHQETAVIANLVRQLTGEDESGNLGVSADEMQIAAQSGNPFLSTPTLSMDRFGQIIAEPRDGIVLDKPLELPDELRADDVVNSAPGALKKSTFDAFAVMGEQMKGMDTVRFDVAKLASEAADKSATDSAILYGVNSPQSFSAQSAGNLEASIAQISGADKLVGLDASKDQPINRTISREKAPLSIEMKDQLQANIGTSAVQSRGDLADRQNNGSNNDQSQGQTSQDKTVGDVQPARGQSQPVRTQQSPATFAQSSEQTEVGLSPQQRHQIMQKVLNHATMMVKEGGGTVRLDLGTSELGSMQMAISMNKDQVDMRVITSSDRVREVMMAELGQLKNALSVQNVRLGNVEVGVSGRQPNGFAAFDGNANQGRGQNFSQRDRNSESRGIQGIKGLARRQFAGPIRMDTSAVSGLFNANGGKIAVRA